MTDQVAEAPTLRERVYAEMNGYAEARKAVDLAISAAHVPPADAPNVSAATTELHQQIREHLAAGTPVPWDAGKAVFEAMQASELLRIRHTALMQVRATAQGDLQDFQKTKAGDGGFKYLDRELTHLVEKAQTDIADLHGAMSGNEALADGRPEVIEAWQDLIRLTRVYDEIRTVQRELLREHHFSIEIGTSTALYRDALEVADWFVAERLRSKEFLRNDTDPDHQEHNRWIAETFRAPELNSVSGWWPEQGDRTQALITIITQTDPWVPTPELLIHAHKLASAACQPQFNEGGPRGRTGIQEAARANYWRLVGGEPLIAVPLTNVLRDRSIIKTGAVLNKKLREAEARSNPDRRANESNRYGMGKPQPLN